MSQQNSTPKFDPEVRLTTPEEDLEQLAKDVKEHIARTGSQQTRR